MILIFFCEINKKDIPEQGYKVHKSSTPDFINHRNPRICDDEDGIFKF